MNLTRDDVKRLGRRAEQPTKELGDVLAVFVAGKLRNLTNERWGWKGDMAYKRRWREKVAHAVLESGYRPARGSKGLSDAQVTFLGRVWSLFDGDGLQAAMKPVRDGLVESRVLTGDADKTGNVFEYRQVVDRARRGVEIHVRPIAYRAEGAKADVQAVTP